MVAHRMMSRILAVLCAAVGVFAVTAVPALAVRGHVFSGSFASEQGAGNGEFNEPSGVAVDQASGDVYVVDKGNDRVEYFSSTGTYLGQFNGSGLLLGEGKAAGSGGLAGEVETGSFSSPEAIAVDNDSGSPSFGDVYVADVGHNVIDKYSSTGAYVSQLAQGSGGASFGTIYGIGVDTTGTLWVLHANVSEQEVKEVDSYSGTVVNEFLSNRKSQAFAVESGFAVDSLTNFYVKTFFYGITKLDSSGNVLTQEFDSLLNNPDSSEAPSGVSVDLSSNDVYIDNADAQGSVGRFSSSGSLIERFGMGRLSRGAGIGVNSSTGTVYVADAAGDKIDVFGLEPPSAPTVDEESASNVSGGSATLRARVDPRGLSSEYHFEYSPCPSGPACVGPVPDGQLTGEYEAESVSLHIQGLQANTTYSYRLVAHNQLGTVEGEALTFTTQAPSVSSAAALPDGRAWEMVSPPNKQGAALQTPFNELGSAMQASVNGDAVSYTASGPTEDQPQGNRAAELPQLFSRRSVDGWATKVITTPYSESGRYRAGFGMEYRLFSSDLSTSALLPYVEAKLSSEATELTPYLRHDDTCEASPATCYVPLVTAANVAPGVKFAEAQKFVIPLTGTPDLSHVMLESVEVNLLPGGSEEFGGLYEWSEGQLQLVTILPDGKPAPRGGALGYQNQVVRHAISDDGSRVVFMAAPEGSGSQNLYVRDMVKGETVQANAVEPGAQGGSGEARFQNASSDGSRVFFTDIVRLTVDSTAIEGKPDLYEFDVETGKLTDLTADSNQGEYADVQGMLQGASEDGSYVYFVANGVLAPGAVPGHCTEHSLPGATCNLYVRHTGVTTFIAALSAEDQPWNEEARSIEQEFVTARVSPNGRWFAFMSDRSLTGYDSRDANSGEPDEEVFLYDATSKHLSCASCNPTGARPVGMFESTISKEVGPLVDRTGVWSRRWLAATIPGLAQIGDKTFVYQARYLNDGGRLFFNSNDALVPQDVNGTMDVYQYEPEGVGDCTSESATFGSAADGCVGLISSGGSAEESTFMDASESGDDVFFLTAAQLRPEDFDTELDMYDARVCSSSSPCLPVPPASPPPCSTGDSCKPAPTPQPAIFGAAPSATFSGIGNLPSGPVSRVRIRSFTRAQKLERALHACQRKHQRRKRRACVRQARKRYASKPTGRRAMSQPAGGAKRESAK
jgi:DNA-binding beta-propeller fold protein YncE